NCAAPESGDGARQECRADRNHECH
ncbi:RNA-dependent RNA polymerase, partial [Psidium guajava]